MVERGSVEPVPYLKESCMMPQNIHLLFAFGSEEARALHEMREGSVLLEREAAMDEKTFILSLANANSPMSWDYAMLGSAKVYAENNQATMISPFLLAGASAEELAARSQRLFGECRFGFQQALQTWPEGCRGGSRLSGLRVGLVGRDQHDRTQGPRALRRPDQRRDARSW